MALIFQRGEQENILDINQRTKSCWINVRSLLKNQELSNEYICVEQHSRNLETIFKRQD